MPHLGAPELLILLIIGVVFFGAGKLPQLGSSLGSGIKNFKKAMNGEEGGDEDDDDEEIDVTPKKKKKKAEALASSSVEDEDAPAKAEAIRPK